MASEKKQRLLSKELISVEVVAESAPFTFSLPDKIFELLDQHARYQV